MKQACTVRDPQGEWPLYRYDGPEGPVYSDSVRKLMAKSECWRLSVPGLMAYLKNGVVM